jgi:hypothetical protein
VTWSDKRGTVLVADVRRDPNEQQGALVLLDPFITRWNSTQVTICNLEVVYDPRDLIVEPPRTRR